MIDKLKFFKAELRLNISTSCHHLRNKSYILGSPDHQNALMLMVYHQLVVDELNEILHKYATVVEELEKHLKGEDFDPYYWDDPEPLTFHQYLLHWFGRQECSLGTATEELSQWVATHAERQQRMGEGLRLFFPDINMVVFEQNPLTGDQEPRPATESEVFEKQTRNLLSNIEASNALIEFNEQMLQVKQLLEQ